MTEPSNDYLLGLLRRKVSGETLAQGEALLLSRYEHEMDQGDNEPHRVSRSQTLEILSSSETRVLLATCN